MIFFFVIVAITLAIILLLPPPKNEVMISGESASLSVCLHVCPLDGSAGMGALENDGPENDGPNCRA